MNIYWAALLVAGLLEVSWAIGMKLSNGFSHPGWTAFTAVTLILSMGLLAYALRALPVGTAYAVWTGIGAVGTALIGIAILGESREPARLVFLAMIVVGIVGLKAATR